MVEEHGAGLFADFRRFFSISVTDVNKSVDIFEALALASALPMYTDSITGAAINGFKHPIHPLFPAIADLIDVTIASIPRKSKKKITYPRPWKNKTALTSKYAATEAKPKAVSIKRFHQIMRSKNRRVLNSDEVNAGR